jgi:hypothetical protein
MRPQGFGQISGNLEDLGWNDMGFEPPKPAAAPRDDSHDAFGEDLDDHPRAHHPTGLTPVGSPVHSQQAEIEDRLNGDDSEIQAAGEEFDETAELYDPDTESESTPEPVVVPIAAPTATPIMAPAPRRAPRPRSAPGSKGKAAFTLRLDPDRHLKLRLACAVGGRSAQQIVTAAVDKFLDEMPDLDSLAAKAKRKG